MSYTELAKHTGLSTSAAHQRVRRLEQRGVITAYRAVIDLEAVGLPMTAFVSVSPIDAADPDDIPDRVAHLHGRRVVLQRGRRPQLRSDGTRRQPSRSGTAPGRPSGQRPRDDPHHGGPEHPLRAPLTRRATQPSAAPRWRPPMALTPRRDVLNLRFCPFFLDPPMRPGSRLPSPVRVKVVALDHKWSRRHQRATSSGPALAVKARTCGRTTASRAVDDALSGAAWPRPGVVVGSSSISALLAATALVAAIVVPAAWRPAAPRSRPLVRRAACSRW